MRKWDQSPDKAQVKNIIDRRRLLSGLAALAGMGILLGISLIPGSTGESPDPASAQVGSDAAIAMTAECQLVQHLTYTPCGHSLTRRQTLPAELAGKTRADLEASYDLWQVTSYAAQQVEMAQALDMYCPQHVVLMPDESGMLCVFENRYGDALALVQELNVPISELPDAYQEMIRPGKGFDTREELDRWLESIDS